MNQESSMWRLGPTDRSVEMVYAKLAPHYERRWSSYLRRTHEAVLAALDSRLAAGGSLLELGCGTGALLRRLHAHRPTLALTGLDQSREMLGFARQASPESVRLVQGDFVHSPFGNRQFDCVVSCNALHYCTQPADLWREWQRVLRPGGVAILTDWRGEAWTNRVRQRWLGWWRRGDIQIFDSGQCKQLFEGVGFDDVRVSHYQAGWRWPMMLLTAERSR